MERLIKKTRLLSRVKQSRLALFVFMTLYGASLQAALKPIEKEISQFIESHASDQLSFLATLVNINSGTTHLKGIDQAGEQVCSALSLLGFSLQWQALPLALHRASTLVATHPGHGKKILLIAHLDTVFSPTDSFQKLKSTPAHISGPGVADAKGGITMIISALQALNAVNALKPINITLLLLGDEESAGRPIQLAKKALFNAAKVADVALEFEPSFYDHAVITAYPGIAHWEIYSQGNAAHSSTIARSTTGFGAIFETARLLNAMRHGLGKSKQVSFNPGLFIGGQALSYDKKTFTGKIVGPANVVAESSYATGEFRYFTLRQRDQFKKEMLHFAKQSLPGTSSTFRLHLGKPPLLANRFNRQLLKDYSRISVELGMNAIQAEPNEIKGSGDVAYISQMVPATLSGLGPCGKAIHSRNESIEPKTLINKTKIAALFIYRLGKQKLGE